MSRSKKTGSKGRTPGSRTPGREATDIGAVTRRVFIGVAAFGAAAFIGCEALNTGPIVEDLPDGDEDGLPVLAHENIKPPVANPVAGVDGVIPRSSWAHGGPIMSRILAMDGIQRITFHHSGDSEPFTATDTASAANHLERIRRFHIDPVTSNPKTSGRAWGDIAYHFGIDPAGRIWQLRSLAYQGSHVKYQNAHNLGVVCLGNFNMQAMTKAQQATVVRFAKTLRAKFLVPITKVFTHRELGQSDCPGKNMQPFMVSIRKPGII